MADGEWLLLAGPSGGGKSTLLYLLNGIAPHVLEGEIRGEVSSGRLGAKEHPRSGIEPASGDGLPDPESQLFMLRVGEDVAFGCENLGFAPLETQGQVEHALTRLSLFRCESGGVQPVGRPETAFGYCRSIGDGLPDALAGRAHQRSRRREPGGVAGSVANLHRAGHTILMTEHRLEGLEGLVDRVVTVDGGGISSNGTFPVEKPLSRRCPRRACACPTSLVDLRDVTFALPMEGNPCWKTCRSVSVRVR